MYIIAGWNTLTRTPPVNIIYKSTGHLPAASILTEIEIFQISERQERASSKRFKNMSQPARTTHAGSLRAVCRRKISKQFSIRANIVCNFNNLAMKSSFNPRLRRRRITPSLIGRKCRRCKSAFERSKCPPEVCRRPPSVQSPSTSSMASVLVSGVV